MDKNGHCPGQSSVPVHGDEYISFVKSSITNAGYKLQISEDTKLHFQVIRLSPKMRPQGNQIVLCLRDFLPEQLLPLDLVGFISCS